MEFNMIIESLIDFSKKSIIYIIYIQYFSYFYVMIINCRICLKLILEQGYWAQS